MRPESLPETIDTAPYSPSARAVVNTTPKATPTRMAGKVIMRKICQLEAPSVRAACSCSVPISRRTRNHFAGHEREARRSIVASTIPGRA